MLLLVDVSGYLSQVQYILSPLFGIGPVPGEVRRPAHSAPEDRPGLGDHGVAAQLWGYRRKGWAIRFWRRWYFWATHSRLPAVVKVARMIHGHLDNVLTYFDHRITNATSEGLNSKIQTLKKTLMASATGSI